MGTSLLQSGSAWFFDLYDQLTLRKVECETKSLPQILNDNQINLHVCRTVQLNLSNMRLRSYSLLQCERALRVPFRLGERDDISNLVLRS